jgi:ATP/maltotriose-dependent transcriptional regulator MalT
LLTETVQLHRVERTSFGADVGPLFDRARIFAKLESAGRKRITLLVAAAGCGKSAALRGLHGLYEGWASFDARSYLGRLGQLPIDLQAAIGGDTQRILVDSFDALFDDEQSLHDVVAIVASAPAHIGWVIATRGTFGLPVASWQAYGHCALPIDEADLALTFDELVAAFANAGVDPDDASLRDVLVETQGWPAGVKFALEAWRTSGDAKDAGSLIRLNAIRFWNEQVLASLSADEKATLWTASTLPAMNVRLLEAAGCDEAAETLQRISARTSIVQSAEDGEYLCHPLARAAFGQIPIAGAERRARLRRITNALERFDYIQEALLAALSAGAGAETLELLTRHGFVLLERGSVESVRDGLDALDPTIRESDAAVVTLRGLLQSAQGNPMRAEATLRRAIAIAHDDPDVEATARLKLAALVLNHGGNVGDVIEPLLLSSAFSDAARAEVLSLIGAVEAASGRQDAASDNVTAAIATLAQTPFDSARARTLQRIGVASMYLGRYDRAKDYLSQASELALELENFSAASRAFSALSNLVCHEYDDVMAQLWYAEQAADAAFKSHDVLELQTSLAQVAAAEMRRGNAEESAGFEELVAGVRSDPQRAALASTFRALRLAWDGDFAEANRLLAPCWTRLTHYFDRVLVGGQYAAFLAIAGRRGTSIEVVSQVLNTLDTVDVQGLFRVRCVTLGLLFCAIAECINDRATHASRIARKIFIKRSDPVTGLAGRIAREFIGRGPSSLDTEALLSSVGHLPAFGYADVARVLEAVLHELATRQRGEDVPVLTAAEVNILQLLGEGFSTKDIAEQSGRSINTVRTHLANAINKLQCHGRAQAVAAARQRKLIF